MVRVLTLRRKSLFYAVKTERPGRFPVLLQNMRELDLALIQIRIEIETEFVVVGVDIKLITTTKDCLIIHIDNRHFRGCVFFLFKKILHNHIFYLTITVLPLLK